MRRIYLPVLLENVDRSQAGGFVVLFTLESTCRALLMTIVPLQAYTLLQSAQMVSVIYLAVSLTGLVASLGLPIVMHLIPRRYMMTLGALTYMAAATFLATGTLPGLITGLALQISATAMLEVTINLYLLDHIPRKELNTFEPRRLLWSGLAFAAGPWLGVYLHENVANGLTYIVVTLTAALMLIAFWKLRLGDSVSIQPAKGPPPNPIKYIPRFINQKRLVLAWTLAVGRNGWWLMFFVYTPIFVTQSGYSPELGGALVSLGVLPMIFVRQWGKLGQKIGLRKLLMGAYAATGGISIVAGLSGDWAIATMGFLVFGAFLATMIDGAGNVPFLRAVHPHERADMTSVYTTYRHGTSLFTPSLFAAVLALLPLNFVFVSGGLATLGMAWLSGFLPKRL
ncbi:MAG: MFS transporter [Pseudomonadota bacterium]